MRARNIKPGFFKNEYLAELEPLARILFSGLWCLADREGKFEWRPKRIKAEILPYDNCDIECLLMSLHSMKFIYKYSHDGKEYGYIPKFNKNQNPHPHEAKSILPDPIEFIEENQCHDMQVTSSEMSETNRADSLIPDSLIPDTHKGDKSPMCPHKEIIKLYHEILPTLPKVKAWNNQRQTFLRTRWNEDKERQNLEWWKDFFEDVSRSDFLTGKRNGFKATLEWLVRPSNFLKTIEGNYVNKEILPGDSEISDEERRKIAESEKAAAQYLAENT